MNDLRLNDEKLKLYNKINRPRIIAIGGGKGGAGKSIVSTMLGICLSGYGKKTVLVDADFTGANLHGYLGFFDVPKTLWHFFSRKIPNLQDIVLESSFNNLSLIAGLSGHTRYTQIQYWEQQKLVRNLKNLDADYVIVDLGAGTSYALLDLFINADDSIVVTTPESTSLYDAYGFIRASLFRKLKIELKEYPQVVNELADLSELTRGMGTKSIMNVLERTSTNKNVVRLIEKNLRDFQPKIVFNAFRAEDSVAECRSLCLAIQELLNITPGEWGKIRYDENVKKAVRNLRPDLLLTMDGKASEDIVRLVNRNIIARELDVQPSFPNNSSIGEKKSHVRICNYRCIAWNCCEYRQGGQECTVHSVAPVCRKVS